jgi:hypothetical protein
MSDNDSWSSFNDNLNDAADTAALKKQLATVSRQLYEVKHKHADYLQAVEDAVTQAMAKIKVKPVPGPQKTRSKKAEEICVPLLSDLQTGKITPDYDSAVARERVLRYARKIVDLADIQRQHHPCATVLFRCWET